MVDAKLDQLGQILQVSANGAEPSIVGNLEVFEFVTTSVELIWDGTLEVHVDECEMAQGLQETNLGGERPIHFVGAQMKRL